MIQSTPVDSEKLSLAVFQRNRTISLIMNIAKEASMAIPTLNGTPRHMSIASPIVHIPIDPDQIAAYSIANIHSPFSVLYSLIEAASTAKPNM